MYLFFHMKGIVVALCIERWTFQMRFGEREREQSSNTGKVTSTVGVGRESEPGSSSHGLSVSCEASPSLFFFVWYLISLLYLSIVSVSVSYPLDIPLSQHTSTVSVLEPL